MRNIFLIIQTSRPAMYYKLLVTVGVVDIKAFYMQRKLTIQYLNFRFYREASKITFKKFSLNFVDNILEKYIWRTSRGVWFKYIW